MVTPAQTNSQHSASVGTEGNVSAVRLRFAQLKVAFNNLNIRQPLVFIQWKRPNLSADEVRRIRMGLTGRAAGSDGHLADICAAVVDELKAA